MQTFKVFVPVKGWDLRHRQKWTNQTEFLHELLESCFQQYPVKELSERFATIHGAGNFVFVPFFTSSKE